MSASQDAAPGKEEGGAPAKLKLMDEDAFIFCPKPSTFTPLYEPSDSASYTARFGSVNAGSFELYVGGGAINLGFARILHKVGHPVDDYEFMHKELYKKVKEQPQTFRSERGWKLAEWPADPPDAPPADPPKRLPHGVASTSVLLSTLPSNFEAMGHLAGTVFVDVFEADMRPEANPNNRAMVYVVGPEGSLAKDSVDFLSACEYTGANIARALTEHNAAHKSDTLEMVRMCLVSGGVFRHPETSKEDVAKAFIKGMSQEVEVGKTPKIEFAYDEDVFQIAYLALKAEARPDV